MKTPFVTKAQVDEMIKKYPTPFHLYDEKGIRENARKLYQAFSWNKGFKEFFAVKATPNPTILRILKEEGCGTDCSSLTELMMSDKLGFTGDEIMFSSKLLSKKNLFLLRSLVQRSIWMISHILTSLKRQQEFLRRSAADIIRVEPSLFPQQSWTTPEMPSMV